MADFTTDGNTIAFWVRIKPRSNRQRLVRDSSGGLCLELTAPPVDGRANEAAIEFLAEALRVTRSSVEIVTGAKARRKLFRITVTSAQETRARLEALAQQKGC
ncbi:MAG TPA: DUF167 domain-containing protein [Terriglobia bacterium]|nr:DUF167 domain-containing protein [Terriglobia bacterium]